MPICNWCYVFINRYSHFEDEMYRADIEWTKIEDLKFDHEKDKTVEQLLNDFIVAFFKSIVCFRRCSI